MLPTPVLLTICDFLCPTDRLRFAAIARLPSALAAAACATSPADIDFATALADLNLLALIKRADPSSLVVFPHDVEAAAVDRASALGRIAVLDWWHRRRGTGILYTPRAVDEASANGHVAVLRWWLLRWREREPTGKMYTKAAFDGACAMAHWEVLEWWRDSGRLVLCSFNLLDTLSESGRLDVLRWLKAGGTLDRDSSSAHPWTFRYTGVPLPNASFATMFEPSRRSPLCFSINALVGATRNGQLSVLRWWKQLPRSSFPRSLPNIMDVASGSGRLEMLEFWKESGVEFEHSPNAVDLASQRGDVAVLQWWATSGLEFQYTARAVDGASSNNHLHVLQWWKSSRFEMKYTEVAIDLACREGHRAVLRWWRESDLQLKFSGSSLQ